MITFDELIKIHEQLWTDTTIDQQIAKYAEEHEEFMNTQRNCEEELFELADMVIVSSGIARFNYIEGLEYLYDAMDDLYKTQWDLQNLWHAVEEKMLANEKRKWKKVGSVGYHHE